MIFESIALLLPLLLLINYRTLLKQIGIPLEFFTARFDFLRDGIASAKDGRFAFNLFGGRRVISLSGSKENQDLFFKTPSLSLDDGYDLIFGSIASSEHTGNRFSKRMASMMKVENLSKSIPLLVKTSNIHFDKLGSEGVLDPFWMQLVEMVTERGLIANSSLYGLVYRLTWFAVGPREVALDEAKVFSTLPAVEAIERTNSWYTILFPSLPSWSKLNRTIQGAKFYFLIKSVVESREAQSKDGIEADEDSLSILLSAGDNIVDCVTTILGALFAGLINTGINVNYLLGYLGLSCNTGDRERVLLEIEAMVAKHGDSSLPIHEQLGLVPFEAWESELPFFDASITESIRLGLSGSTLRKAQKDLVGTDIKKGDYLAIPFALVHADPDFYDDPLKFNPSRFEGKEDEKYKFFGWGRGLHPCAGMRFAKLELKIILACFLTQFDYVVTDKAGAELQSLHEVDLNTPVVTKPKGKDRFFFKYSQKKV